MSNVQLAMASVVVCCCLSVAFAAMIYVPPQHELVRRLHPVMDGLGCAPHILYETEGGIGDEGQTYVWALHTSPASTGGVAGIRALQTVPNTNGIQVVTILRNVKWITAQTASFGPKTEYTNYGLCYTLVFPFLFEGGQRKGWLDVKVMYGRSAEGKVIAQITNVIESVAREFRPKAADDEPHNQAPQDTAHKFADLGR